MTRPVVDLPQPLSPTSPSVSPRLMSKLTPSTALTAPTWRDTATPRLMGKCLRRFLTCTSGGSAEAAGCACCIATLTHLLPRRLVVRVDEARRFVAFRQLQKFRLRHRADVPRVLAPGVEPAALGHVERTGDDALDGLQPLGLLAQLR